MGKADRGDNCPVLGKVIRVGVQMVEQTRKYRVR